MDTRRERRRHHRESPTGGRRIPVRHRSTAGGEWQAGEALNIGAGGAFVIGASWPAGTEVEIAVDVASRTEPLVVTGTVRWTSGDGSEEAAAVGALIGAGVQFLDLDLDLIMELQAHLARLEGEGEGGGDDDDDDIPATD